MQSLLSALILVAFSTIAASGEPAPVLMRSWGGRGTAPGQFSFARGIAVDNAGFVYMTDQSNTRVQKFDRDGNCLLVFGSSGGNLGQFLGVTGIAVDAVGNIFVTDSSGPRVNKFDSAGHFLKRWGSNGTGNGQFQGLQGIDVAPDNSVYVSDFQRIQHFDSQGRFLGALAQSIYGRADGLTVTASGRVYMCDRDVHRVEAFDGAGTYLFGWSVDADGGWHIPNAMEDAGGRIYVTDENQRVQEFSESGSLLLEWDLGPGSTTPVDIAATPEGDIYVLFDSEIRRYGPAAVPARLSSWGHIKARYR